MGNYTENGAVSALKRINGITVDTNKKIIIVNGFIAGNSTWGKISFLTKYCGYTQCMDDDKAQEVVDKVNETISIHTPVEREKFTKHKVKP